MLLDDIDYAVYLFWLNDGKRNKEKAGKKVL
jgi:hypothetical protein